MKTTNDYLDELTEKKKLKNDAALAKFLEITPGMISNYRSGKRVMDDTMCAIIADALGIQPWEIITAANRERATSESARKRWEKIQLRFQQTATLGLLMFVTSIMTPSPAEAAPTLKTNVLNTVYYVKSQVRRIIKKAASAFDKILSALLPVRFADC